MSTLARLILLLVLLGSAPAQVAAQLAPGGGDPPPPPPVSTDDVRAALEELLAAGGEEPEAITTGDPEIDPGALDFLLEPLTLEELRLEMSSWSGLLREAVAELSFAELELFELNSAQAEAAEAAAGGETEGEAATEPEGDAAAAEAEMTPEQEALVERISEIRETRTAISDRFRLVMDAFEAKGGDPTETEEYRAYIADVGGVTVDTRNWRTALLTIQEWAVAEDGGRRLARNLGIVVLATAIGFAIGWVVSLVVNLALRRTELSSKLMRSFLRRWIERVGALVGFLVGLSWIGTNMTPILAGLGAAGFILAFALQNTISNFASGMLILFLRPFDAGDEIEAAGTSGKVERVSLFSTYLTTPENRTVIVPNNKIWEDVITN
ncbi:MAG TPA: mechanosensitive ion channel [Amaricoccus sp.]|uniref:mechanosensitive ion channel family protein n=1 Tax=Amaricoccus sp. TaxID=1872485 RepID=UPI002CB561B9|nr:mechanosensitive ion channel domain-containing protein [Amaricoccus sp.]HMQ93198.1 mechanosensitive ion channel [Amaricoccus sp.]HMR54321.1 mechanosensitive ion channel [Amaricoccus sp.]HMR60466.1 mechanosensitive ion channel [Amaricoccus sp.]HMU01312.1 mechanosensitive ion channel [Amaricoccus sp.]